LKKKLILVTLSTLLILITFFLVVNNTTEKKEDEVYDSYHINFLNKKITFYTYEKCHNGEVKVKKYSKHGLRTDIELYVECPPNPFLENDYLPGTEKLPYQDTIQLKTLTPSINVYTVQDKKKKYYKFKFQKPYINDEEFKEYLKSLED